MTNDQKEQLTNAIADLIRISAVDGRIWDCLAAVIFDTDDESIACVKLADDDKRTLLTAASIIAHFGVTADSEAWAAANPEEAASQYVEAHYWDIDAAIDELMAEA